MSDSEDKARSLRIKRAIAREIAGVAEDPVVAQVRKVRREIDRECGYDTKKYARYIREQTEAFERESGLNLKRWNKPALRLRAAQARSVKMMSQKGGKGA